MNLDETNANGAIPLCGNPQATETYEQHVAYLRESIEEARTGQTRPAREVLKELAIKYGLTLQPDE